MSGIVDHILNASTWTVLGLVGLIVFAEDALFVGFVLPGETTAILGGVAAKLGHAPLWAVLVTVIAAAVVGDSVGYEIGRDFLARRGGSAVFLGRWVAFFRAVMPALAGTARMPYPRFLMFNAAGGIIWGTVVVLVGYAAGASYTTVEKTLGRGTAVAVLAIVVVAALVWRIRKHRTGHPTNPPTPDNPSHRD
jgi:membrane-associated protein